MRVRFSRVYKFTLMLYFIVRAVKFARQNGIHVSPTVLWDGLVQNQVSSGWEEPEWTAFLAKQVTA